MIGKRTDLTLTLSVPALDGKEIYVTAVDGRERISDLFRYEIEFTSADTIDPLDAIGQSATLTINAGGNVLTARGILAEFSAGDATPAGDFAYQTVLAPRLSLLDLSRQNLVYGTADPIKLGDLVDSILTNGAGTDSTSGGHGLNIRHELRLRSDYLARAQIVQYGESDLTFLKRQCEHEGVFFFFEHDDQSEIVVFGDKNDVCKNVDIDGAPTITFNNKRGSARTGDLAMTRFRAIAKPVPGTVLLRDYNETKTSPPLKVSETVTDQGFGKIVEYGQHFDDEDQGKSLAKVRAEEIGCRRVIYKGESNVPQLRAGTVFTLTDHTLSSKPMQFLVISVRHSVSVPPPSAFAPLPFGHEARAARPYTNEIECVPFDTPFRPERKTPRPNVAGLFTAQIDAEEKQGERGWMDERGRYKVRFAFDDGKYTAGKASDYVRQSQPYLGPNSSGLHFPLLQGTEVVVGYLNGDPDRPVVVGAVSDEKNGDPVTKNNRTLNRIETASNVMLEIDDREAPSDGAAKDAPFFRIDTPAEVGGRSFTGTYLRMGKSVDKDEKTLLPKAIQDAATAAATAGTTGPSTDGAMLYTNQDLNVNVDGSANYTYGTGYATETKTGNSAHKVDKGKYTLNTSDNIEMTTPADILLSAYNMTVTLSGSSSIKVSGTQTTTVSGDSEGVYWGTSKTNHFSTSKSLMWDDTTLMSFSAAFSMKLSIELAINTGLQTKICIGGEVKFAAPQDSKFVAGLNLTYVYGLDFKYVSGATNQIAVSAFKFLTMMDYKNAATDFKHVTLDAKIAESSISKTELEFYNAVVSGKDQKIVSLNNSVESMKSTTSSRFTTLFCVA